VVRTMDRCCANPTHLTPVVVCHTVVRQSGYTWVELTESVERQMASVVLMERSCWKCLIQESLLHS
jgi:hypothetical protein